jgi:hypothetical protein
LSTQPGFFSDLRLVEEIIVKQAAGMTIRLTQPFGAGDVYHVYIDNWYQGQVVARQGKYRVELNPNSKLTEKHKKMIVEAITANQS